MAFVIEHTDGRKGGDSTTIDKTHSRLFRPRELRLMSNNFFKCKLIKQQKETATSYNLKVLLQWDAILFIDDSVE